MKFYVLFYIGVALFVAISIVELYGTIGRQISVYKRDNVTMHPQPELEIRPTINENSRTSLIWYNENDIATIDKWISLLDTFLDAYRMEQFEFRAKVAAYCNFKHPPKNGYVCPADIDHFGPCSPPYYGYYSFSPCVFLRLSKMYNWIPDCYNDSEQLPLSMPNDLVEHIKLAHIKRESNQVWISCAGEDDIDREHVAQFNYYPSRGIPLYFYPVPYNMVRYLPPVIAVEIVDPSPGVLISIECRVWAKNIKYNGAVPEPHRRGSIKFAVMRDNLEQTDYLAE